MAGVILSLSRLHNAAVAGALVPHIVLAQSGGSLLFGGPAFIAGTVTVQGQVAGGVAANIPVHLYDRETGAFVRRARTDANGAYRFDGLNSTRKYFVLALRPQADYNAVVADAIEPGED